MDSTNTNVELIVQQGENVLLSMKELKNVANKKGKVRFDLYERYCANLHSYYVYTLMDPEIENAPKVVDFQEKLNLFGDYFKEVAKDFESEVDTKSANEAYDNVFPAYNAMVSALGFPDREVTAKKF